ncbi:MAG: hypothetical protein H7Y18_21135 [Clostridiaceae bacterium]|nr:hypothetical protein [Clostridiaceae bacterium]
MKFILFILLIITISLCCIGCGSNFTKISSVTSQANFQTLTETTKAGTFKMSYENFEGNETRTLNVNKGDKIKFDYTSSVKEGTLTIVINDPYGVPIANLPVKKKGSIKIVAKGTGKISLVVTGKNTSGSFELLWKGFTFN